MACIIIKEMAGCGIREYPCVLVAIERFDIFKNIIQYIVVGLSNLIYLLALLVYIMTLLTVKLLRITNAIMRK